MLARLERVLALRFCPHQPDEEEKKEEIKHSNE